MPDPCPDPETLAGYAGGALARGLRRTVEAHLSLCDPCRGRVSVALGIPAGSLRAEEDEPTGLRRERRVRIVSAAAAAIVMVIGGISTYPSIRRFINDPPPPFARGPSALPRIHAPLLSGKIYALPGGGSIRTGPGIAARFEPPRPGEPHLLNLEHGECDLEVDGKAGAFRIRTPAGEVQVLGTRFSVRAIRFPFRERPVRCTVIEVTEGAVQVSSSEGALRTQAGHRSVLVERQPPIGQMRLGDPPLETGWEAVLKIARGPGRSWSDLLPLCVLHRQATGYLQGRLATETDPEVRDVAARCIEALGSTDQIRALEKIRKEAGE